MRSSSVRIGSRWIATLAAITGLTAVPVTSAARDLCAVLKDKGVLNEQDYTECKADQVHSARDGAATAKEATGPTLPKWLEMITPFGDIRLRHEGFYQEEKIARNRFRFRARIGLTTTVSDEISGTVRLATGDPNDPISTNQTFTNTFTRKSVNLDWAYLTLKPGTTFHIEPGWFTLTAGKFGVNSYRASELVWDDDVSPEGATETLTVVERKEGVLRGLKVSGFQWVVDEVAAAQDPWMGGGQVVADAAFGPLATWSVGFADYHYEGLNEVASTYLSGYKDDPNAKDPKTAPFIANTSQNTALANSNDVISSLADTNNKKKILGYKSGYNILNVTSELNSPDPVGLGVPAGVFGDVAYNTQARGRNVGLYAGAGIGNAGKDWYHNVLRNQGDWGLSYTYAWVEKDSVLSIFSFSDINEYSTVAAKAGDARPTQKGGTNLISHILRFDYAVLPNLQLTAKAYVENVLDRKISNAALTDNPTLVRTQLDAMLRF